jgi:hypothetical protein
MRKARARRPAARRDADRPPEPTPRFRRLVRESATLRSHQREVFSRFEQTLAAVLAEETGAPADAVERSSRQPPS